MPRFLLTQLPRRARFRADTRRRATRWATSSNGSKVARAKLFRGAYAAFKQGKVTSYRSERRSSKPDIYIGDYELAAEASMTQMQAYVVGHALLADGGARSRLPLTVAREKLYR